MTEFMKCRNMEEDMAEDRQTSLALSGWTALGCIDPIYIYIFLDPIFALH